MTKGLCGICKSAVDAKIIFREGSVYLDKFCPRHGHQLCLAASSVEWYLDCLSFVAPSVPPKRVLKEVSAGCPFDCGACPSHQQAVFLPVIPITSACNLDCPICYTINKNDHAHHLSTADMQKTLDHLLEDHPELDIINFTGGEPTLHPRLLDFLEMCRAAGIRRLTISTNGLRLRDEEYVRKLAALDARIVLSLDTFRRETDLALLGADTVRAKLEVLELLEKHNVSTTILPAVAAGLNDDEVGPLFELMLAKPNIVSLELHTLTFTGQGGVGFDRTARITIPDLHRRLQAATADRITPRDFVPSPLAHPHCYSICYLLMLDGGGYVPFTRLTSRETLFDLLSDSLYIEPRERLQKGLSRNHQRPLWANPQRVPESEQVLADAQATIARTVSRPAAPASVDPGRAATHRRTFFSRAIYIHSHMDEENFDVARVMKCCVGVPEVDGSNIPTCSYNVLYRERDQRFADPAMLEPHGTRPGPQADCRRGMPRTMVLDLPIIRQLPARHNQSWPEARRRVVSTPSAKECAQSAASWSTAHRIIRGGKVYLRKQCPLHGQSEALISGDATWFLNSLKYAKPGRLPLKYSTATSEGCPRDCGLCPDHEQHSCLPIIEITNHCNLECPICIVQNRHNYHMSCEEFAATIQGLIEKEDLLDTVNLSGGEPTMHPEFLRLLDIARQPEIFRISISTNGLRIASDLDFCRELAAREV